MLPLHRKQQSLEKKKNNARQVRATHKFNRKGKVKMQI